MPAVTAIDHVQLAMPAGREDDARRFYSGLLGLPERTKPPALAARGGAWFESAAVKIHVGVEADFRRARKAHPALRVHAVTETQRENVYLSPTLTRWTVCLISGAVGASRFPWPTLRIAS
jgi:hypothetical protein